jgi:putative PIN family toxin of toxin-antitoxin system
MTTAVLDTNVFLQALIGRPTSASIGVLRAADDGRFRPLFCQSTIDELLNVLSVPRIRALHGLTDDEIQRFVSSLLVDAVLLPDPPDPAHSLARDPTDSRFLALAAAASADFVVTNDRRDLQRLRAFEGTRSCRQPHFCGNFSSDRRSKKTPVPLGAEVLAVRGPLFRSPYFRAGWPNLEEFSADRVAGC